MKRRPGYLAKMRQGIHHTTVRLLLEVLEALEVDLGAFFAQALDLPPRPDLALDRLARQLPPETATCERLKRRLERTAALLANRPTDDSTEDATGTQQSGPAAGWEHLMSLLNDCHRPRERRQLLRSSPRFHHPSFLLALLQHLDRGRVDNPRETSGILVTLVLHVLPRLPVNRARQNLLCRTLGLWASCQHRLGRHRNAVFALRQALHLARLGKLRASTANLLEKGAQILEAHNAAAAALAFLDEAQILYLDLGRSTAANRVLAARARLREASKKSG